jgi:tripartite ATP-independent transporter DctM subunit
MSVQLLTAVLFGILVIYLVFGLPVAFSLGFASVILILLVSGPDMLFLIFTTAFSDWNNYILLAIPLFVIMANILAECGIADKLYELMYQWMGRLRGGLAMGTVIICAIFAAMSGVSAAGTVTMGLIALPSMLKRGYDKNIALGSISAAGSLGILIPPSVTMVIFASLTGASVGHLFIGGLMPGIMLAGIFIVYIGIRSWLQPSLGPPVPREEQLPVIKRLGLIKAVIAPIILIILVLGVIYTGVATPTEAAGIGALGAFVVAIINRRFSWKMLREASRGALFMTVMVGWIVLGAKSFAHIYTTIGVPEFLTAAIGGSGFSPWAIMVVMQVILLILGCFIDPMGIMMITIPVFMPIVQMLGYDPVWFGVVFTLNMEIGYITPPFGFNLFYMKGVAPAHITLQDIYKSVIWFVVLELVGLALIIIFPQIVLWLPNLMGNG